MIEAVSAILVCDDEVFIIQRQFHLRAFPGYHAYPGGKIDAEDYAQKLPHSKITAFPDAHMAALNRELIEELSFDLFAALASGAVQEVTLFGTAITPAFEAHRFRAHYYKIVLDHKPVFIVDENEIRRSLWARPAQLYAQYMNGDAMMVVPMRRSIASLAENISAINATKFNLESDEGALPCLDIINGLTTLPIPSNTLPPATTTNALLLGDKGQRQVLVDPSPKSAQVYQALLKTLANNQLDAILITHRHPDHHERAMDMAREKNIPVLLTAQTLVRLKTEFGQDYVDGIELEIISEGMQITRWKQHPIHVYELPGHDDGMVGLAPENLAWFFIADLAQSYGSIVIPEEGGDLAVYFRSLQRVIDLNPKAVLPSHGIPSAGVNLIEQTLAHRIKRENQIRKLMDKGVAIDDMRVSIYPLLDEKLVPLAMQTINQHVRKLVAERCA
jgi:glyoxylase-like metal-dependent hydrolase (beta-lactamase superfamily II)/8-oxo-dGTP pyrophosphatase MutT (NUDIX family)